MNIALNLVAVKTIIRKEVVRVLRIWVQTIVPPAITMTLYFIIFGNLIGRRRFPHLRRLYIQARNRRKSNRMQR